MDKYNGLVKIVAILTILIVTVYIVLHPYISYLQTPRIVLFFLISMLPAILLGSEVTNHFELKLPAFILTTTGAAAVFFGALMLLVYFSKEDQKFAVYNVYNESRSSFSLEFQNIAIEGGNVKTDYFTKQNHLLVIFPPGIDMLKMEMHNSANNRGYNCSISYSGNKERDSLIIGKDLKLITN